MPIQFPPSKRDTVLTDLTLLYHKPFDAIPAPNMNTPGARYDDDVDHHQVSSPRFRPNVRNLANSYVDVQKTSVVNPIQPTLGPEFLTDNRSFFRVMGVLNMVLSGVSKDSTGVALGNCTVMIFRTEDRSLVAETVSDASGNWSVPMLKGGPFFLVEYKTGAPDVAGTSVNTLVPTQA